MNKKALKEKAAERSRQLLKLLNKNLANDCEIAFSYTRNGTEKERKEERETTVS